MLQILDNTPQAIAMSHYQQFVGRLQIREDDTLPVRHDTLNRIFQRLRTGQFGIGHFLITVLKTRITRVILGQCMRNHIKAPAPYQHLLVTVLGSRLCLVQPLQLAVVFLIQPPRFLHRNPVLVEAVQHTIQCLHGTLQIGSIRLLEAESLFCQQLTRPYSFSNAFLCQINIRPPREAVFLIPCTLAVAKQNNLFHIVSFQFYL